MTLRSQWRTAPVAACTALMALGCVAPSSEAVSFKPPPGPPPVIRSLIPIASGESEQVHLQAGFTPYRLHSSTTIDFAFQIKSPPHTVPQPLIGINIALPAGLQATTASLGLADCNPHTIYEHGVEGCPPDSLVGRATAIASVPIGPELISEQVNIGLTATPSRAGHLEILYGAEGVTPVFDELVFRGEILEGNPPYGDEIATFIPPIETLPEAPYASVVSMSATIGPQGITYDRRRHGKRVSYQPEGIVLPARCPRKGFQFAATFTFLDEATKYTHAVVPCPVANRRRPQQTTR